MQKNLGEAAYARELPKIRSTHYAQSLRFEAVVFEKSKTFEKRPKKSKNGLFRGSKLFVLKNLGATAYLVVFPNSFYLLKPKPQTWRVVFEKNQEVPKNSEKIEKLTFQRAIIFGAKKSGRSRLCKGASQNPFYSLRPKSQI